MWVNLSELERSFAGARSTTGNSRTVKISIIGDGFKVEGTGIVTFDARHDSESGASTVTEGPSPSEEVPKKRGYKRKAAAVAVEPSPKTELDKRVDALPDHIKDKFGSIVWAKMRTYPYWPAMILDPRRLTDPKLQASALEELDTKFLVCFYFPRNVAPVLFEDVEPWDDTKRNYRSGHPKITAAMRRKQLATAIEWAQKDLSLPVEERMDGLMKGDSTEIAPPEEEVEKPVLPMANLGAINLNQMYAGSSMPAIPPQRTAPQTIAPAPLSLAPVAAVAPVSHASLPLYPLDPVTATATVEKKRRGRPVGSKNRPKDGLSSTSTPGGEKKKPGRPVGSKTKPKAARIHEIEPAPYQMMLAPIVPKPPTDSDASGFNEEVLV